MKLSKFDKTKVRPWWRQRLAVGVAVFMVLLFSSTALAAEVASGDPYILPRGEVVNDDLYVTGSEVTIDGTVEGDLVVSGGYVEINGVIMGDVLAAGGAVVIAGTVQDDVRVAGGAVTLSGSVGDDFFAAAGGGWPGVAIFPLRSMRIMGRNVQQGLLISPGSTIGGDAYIAGGQGTVAGSIGSDLTAAMGSLVFSGEVAGNANLNAESLTIDENAVVQGELSYRSNSDTVVPEGVAASVVEEEPVESEPTRNPIAGFFGWLLRTALILVGYLLVGWLVWTFSPRKITAPVAVIDERPMESAVLGLVAAVAVLPLGAALTFLGVLFWGWFPGGIIIAGFFFGLMALIWLFSPVVTGLWVGRKIGEVTGTVQGELPRLLVGIAVIVLGCRLLTVIPCLGDLLFQLIFLVSFAMLVGSWILGMRRPPVEPSLLPAAPSYTDIAPSVPPV